MPNQKNLPPSIKIEEAWKYHSEADRLFHQRFSFFLVAESFLVLSIVTILVNKDTSARLKSVEIAISLLGMMFTFGWWYVNLRIRRRLDYLKNKFLKKLDSVYKEYMDCVNEPINEFFDGKFHINSQILPITTLIFWWFILFEIILEWCIYYYGIILVMVLVLLYLLMPKLKDKYKT